MCFTTNPFYHQYQLTFCRISTLMVHALPRTVLHNSVSCEELVNQSEQEINRLENFLISYGFTCSHKIHMSSVKFIPSDGLSNIFQQS